MAQYDPQVEAKAIAELQQLTAELRAASEAFQASKLTVEQYDAALQKLQPQLAAQQQLIAEQAKAGQAAARAAQVAGRAADAQARAVESAAEVQARAARDAAEIQARAAEQAARLQQKGAEKAAEVQKKAATEAADHQAREAKRAAAVQGKDAEQAAAIQAAAAQKAAEIQAMGAQGAAEIQARHAQMAAEKQATEAQRAQGIQERAATRAAKIQAEAAQQAATIQEVEATRAAAIQVREATRAATVQAAQQEAAAARIIAAEKAKTAAVETGAATAKDATGKNALMMFQLGQAVEDLQYGFHGVINNLVYLALQRGWSGPLILGLTLVSVAVNQLIKHWDTLVDRFKGGKDINQVREATERLNVQLEETKKKLEELSKQKYLDPTEAKQYAAARQQVLDLEKQITAHNERQARLKALETMQSVEERERSRAFTEVVGEVGGARFQELERAYADRLNEQKADLFRKREQEIARLQKSIDTGEVTRGVPNHLRNAAIEGTKQKIANIRAESEAERQRSTKQAADTVANAAQGRDSSLAMLEEQFPAERDPRTGSFKLDTPRQRAGALLADVRNVETTGKTQRRLNAEGEARDAAWRKAQREKEVAQKRQVEQEQEADELDKMALAREQARERVRRAIEMGAAPTAEDEFLVRQPGVEIGQHRRDAEWERTQVQAEAARRQDADEAQRRRGGPLPQRGPIIPGAGMNPNEQFMAAAGMNPADLARMQGQAQLAAMVGEFRQTQEQLGQAVTHGHQGLIMQLIQILRQQHFTILRWQAQFGSQLNFLQHEWNRAQFRRPSGGPTIF